MDQLWSHISLDFTMGLPPSVGNTTILTIIDCFSMAAHFVALPKLRTALETTWLFTMHVFCLYGIPEDIVSDRGPQFIYGAMVSLSTVFHLQSNGQTKWTNQELEPLFAA